MNSLQFAIDMELDGKKYYLEQAEQHKEDELSKVFHLLADSEEEHANLLINGAKNATYKLNDNDLLTTANNVFTGLANLKIANENTPKQLACPFGIEAHAVVRKPTLPVAHLYQASLDPAFRHVVPGFDVGDC